MPELDYSYIPTFGTEPYEDTVSGGARVTGDNLLISLWTVEDKEGEPPAPAVTIGEIVRPAFVDTNQLETIRPGYPNAMHSRSSAEFYFGPDDDTFVWPLFAVLNPPDELKQQLAKAVEYVGDDASDPSDLGNYLVSKSLQGCYAWYAEMLTAFGAMNKVGIAACEFGYSAYLPLQPVGVSFSFQLPFLRTNGADGVVPEFFDMSTVAGVRALIAAVNRGQFYVGMLLISEEVNGTFARIRWPHSAARG